MHVSYKKLSCIAFLFSHRLLLVRFPHCKFVLIGSFSFYNISMEIGLLVREAKKWINLLWAIE